MKVCRYCKRKFKPNGRQTATCGRAECQQAHKLRIYKKRYKTFKEQIKAEQRALYKKHRKKILSRMRKYHNRDEVKKARLAYAKDYAKSPTVKKRRKVYAKSYWSEYKTRPEVKKARAVKTKEYRTRPAVKKRMRIYLKAYYQKRKMARP